MTRADERVTTTGGREATTLHIPPKLALAVGMPATAPVAGWRWSALTSLARLESGHTPSRKHAEYWGGSIPWISIQDARNSHGRRVESTIEHTNDVGIANSSARILPVNTVCLSRTASVGYVVVMGRPMAISQDFVNWVCTDQLDPDFLKYIFIAEGTDLLRFASGSVHQTIYFPAAKAFYICHPSVAEQKRIVAILDEALEGISTAKVNAEKNLQNSQAIFKSYLQTVFTQGGIGWCERTLEALVDESCSLSYGIVQPGEGVLNGMPIVRPTDLGKKVIAIEGLKRIDPLLAKSYGRTSLNGGELLLCVRGSTGVVSVASNELAGANVTRGIVPIRFKGSQIIQEFGYYILIGEGFQSQIREKTYGAALMQINIGDLRKITVSVPLLSEQKRLVGALDVLSAEADQLVTLYERKVVALDALKKSLLHRAFAGELTADKTTEMIEAVA